MITLLVVIFYALMSGNLWLLLAIFAAIFADVSLALKNDNDKGG